MLLPIRAIDSKRRLIYPLCAIFVLVFMIFFPAGCSSSVSSPPAVHTPKTTSQQTSLNDVPYRSLDQLTPTADQWTAPADPELTPLIPAVSPSSKTTPAEPQPRWGCMVHRIRPGDTLYNIAERYYGRSEHWRLIGRHNMHAINDKGHLLADAFIYLPVAPLQHPAGHLIPPRQLPDAYITAPGDTPQRLADWLSSDPQFLQTLTSLNQRISSPGQSFRPGTRLTLQTNDRLIP